MSRLYFREGLHERLVNFDFFFRDYPDYGSHRAGYCVGAGLEDLLKWMERTSFASADLAVLRSQKTADGQSRFDDEFLNWLEAEGNFRRLELTAIPEGRVIHANEPIVTVRGPLAMSQILETALINHLSYPTLIATKASRVRHVSRGGPVWEFGGRRGPGRGAGEGVRAALIGGCDFTSNVGVSHAMGLDPKGTHAHSTVQLFMALGEGELEAFRAYAAVYPDECTLLVDTIDTLGSGLPNAITVFKELRERGHEPRGVRLDSGDLAYLAIQSARRLDEAGFPGVRIILSGDLDELRIWQILTQIDQEADRYGLDPGSVLTRLAYGVGTRLITSHGDSSLSGVYKLVAVEDDRGIPQPAIKITDTPEKIPTPGEKRIWRLYDRRGLATADLVSSLEEDFAKKDIHLHHPHRSGVSRTLRQSELSEIEELHVPVMSGGERTNPEPSIDELRRRCVSDLDRLDSGVKRIIDPREYHVSLTTEVKELRERLVAGPDGTIARYSR